MAKFEVTARVNYGFYDAIQRIQYEAECEEEAEVNFLYDEDFAHFHCYILDIRLASEEAYELPPDQAMREAGEPELPGLE